MRVNALRYCCSLYLHVIVDSLQNAAEVSQQLTYLLHRCLSRSTSYSATRMMYMTDVDTTTNSFKTKDDIKLLDVKCADSPKAEANPTGWCNPCL